jgi:glycosyltransferase involved in cell wall biosynthesis
VTDRPIRVLRLIARLNVGGPSLHVCYLSSELDKCGYETVLAAGRVGPGEGSMEYLARERGVDLLRIRDLHRDIAPLDDVLATSEILRLLRTFRPHILHTHTAKAGAVGRVAALLAGRDRPKVVVHTFHGHVLRGYFSPLATRGFHEIERRLARSTDVLIAVSPEVRDDLLALGVAPAEKIRVVRLGLDLDARTAAPPGARESVRASLGVANDRFLVGWLGRMTGVKRVDHVLRAFAELVASGVDADLALVGDGPLRGQMEALAADLGVRERCHFAGYREDIGSFYAALDAVTLTSANEGTPVTLIEALAAKVPVVATDVGGVRDVVVDGEGGFLVPAGDVAGVSDRLGRLARDPDLRERLGETGSAFVQERYSVPRLVRDMDTLYRSLLAQHDERLGRRGVTAPIPRSLSPAARARIPPSPARLKIFLLSQYFPPEVGATQSRMQLFAEYLAERGHTVTVIAEFPNHPLGVIPAAYRGRVFEDDRSNGYRVIRVWVKTNPEKTQSTRLAFYASFTALATAVGALAGRADVIFATSPPLFTGLAGSALARLSGAPLVLDVRDLWPIAAEALGQISPGWMQGAAGLLERSLYRDAAAVVTVTRPFCAHIDALRNRPPASILVPNGTLELFLEASGNGRGRTSLGVPDDAFLVTFAGNHGIAQALPSVLEAAGRAGDGIHFALVGDGPMKDALRQQAREAGLDNVHFHAQVPITEVPEILAASDALLVPLSAEPAFADFVPSKMIDFMAIGKPVIVSAHGEAARLLERAGGGLVVAPENPEALADGAAWLAANPAAAGRMAEQGRAYASRRLRAVQAERLEQVILDVVGR